MRRKIGLLFLAAVVAVLCSCAHVKAPPVGGDRDSHGCIGSAGYTWCGQRNKCIRVWEEPCTSEKVINACYECEGLGKVDVDFYGQQYASLRTQSAAYKLERAVSGSGARYTGNNIMLWDKGGNAALELEGKQYKCRAVLQSK